jgi:aminopeptidase N
MLKCFEYWFGPYPFYEDGYKLVESPHLGMEHQSAVAYGNKFQNGYLGRDLSGTGWGLKWDFIIVHESGHEWFANNITSKDLADMWLHEGFTNYSETLFTECQYGKEAGSDYVIGTRKKIANDIPIIGPYGVNREGSGDMYCKGGNLLHTIRQVINNDSTFRNILRGLNKTFYHQTVTTRQVEAYIGKQSGIDFSKVFDQYLRTTQIPVLEYKIGKQSLRFRWTHCVDGFNLPVKIYAGKEGWIEPVKEWKTKYFADWFDAKMFKIDRNFYIQIKKAG